MAAFDFAKVKDPTFFKENVLNAHASFRTYASREEYRTGSSSLALKLDGITVSSTHLRTLLKAGEMETAVRFLGHGHILSGTFAP